MIFIFYRGNPFLCFWITIYNIVPLRKPTVEAYQLKIFDTTGLTSDILRAQIKLFHNYSQHEYRMSASTRSTSAVINWKCSTFACTRCTHTNFSVIIYLISQVRGSFQQRYTIEWEGVAGIVVPESCIFMQWKFSIKSASKRVANI